MTSQRSVTIARRIIEPLSHGAHGDAGQRLKAVGQGFQILDHPGVVAHDITSAAPRPTRRPRWRLHLRPGGARRQSSKLPSLQTMSPLPTRAHARSAIAGITLTLPRTTKAKPNELISSSSFRRSRRASRAKSRLTLRRDVFEAPHFTEQDVGNARIGLHLRSSRRRRRGGAGTKERQRKSIGIDVRLGGQLSRNLCVARGGGGARDVEGVVLDHVIVELFVVDDRVVAQFDFAIA